MTPAPPGDIEYFFGPDRMPGTSSIGERKRFPELFQDTPEDKIETYDHWLDRTLNSTVLRLAECSPAVFPMTFVTIPQIGSFCENEPIFPLPP